MTLMISNKKPAYLAGLFFAGWSAGFGFAFFGSGGLDSMRFRTSSN